MRPLPLLLTALLASPAAAQQILRFEDPSGLEAEAELTLLDGGTTLEVRLRNLSTGVPGGFSNSDQLLTSISFDLGASGENPGDPQIIGGAVVCGPSSATANFSVTSLGSGDDVSGEYGYGNGGTTNLHPNFLTAMASQSTPFGGPNLDGPTHLDGPQGGLCASPPMVPLGGLGAVQDEIVATLLLDQAVSDFDFLRAHGATVEYGSDAAFLTEFPCSEMAGMESFPDQALLNANHALTAAAGALPLLGSIVTVELDDPTDACGLTPGSMSFVLVTENVAPQEILLNNLGCTPGTPGAILIDISQPVHSAGMIPWVGPGNPTQHDFPIAYSTGTCGVTCTAQGFFMDTSGPAVRFVATNRIDIHLGSMP